MRDEVTTTFNAFEKYWGFCDRRELVARAFSSGLVAGWNMRNENRCDLLHDAQARMREEMTNPHAPSNHGETSNDTQAERTV